MDNHLLQPLNAEELQSIEKKFSQKRKKEQKYSNQMDLEEEESDYEERERAITMSTMNDLSPNFKKSRP